jgi:hypothetical protein
VFEISQLSCKYKARLSNPTKVCARLQKKGTNTTQQGHPPCHGKIQRSLSHPFAVVGTLMSAEP